MRWGKTDQCRRDSDDCGKRLPEMPLCQNTKGVFQRTGSEPAGELGELLSYSSCCDLKANVITTFQTPATAVLT